MTRINGEQFNFEQFRKDHPEFSSCTDAEIISILNNSSEDVQLTSAQENSLFSENIQTTAEEGISFANSEADLLQLLESRVRKVEKDSIAAQQNNGVVGKAWHWIKNTVGIGDSSDDVDEAQSSELKLVKEGNVKKAFEELTGVEYTKENIEAFKKGEIKTKSETALDEYKIGQEDSSDFAGDMISGIASMGIYSFAIAAVATMGAPIALAAGAALGAAAAVGAVVKVGTKAIDANLGDKKYESFGKDVVTGAVNGLIAPISACFGGALGKRAVTRLGGQAIKEGAEIVATNSATSFIGQAMLNPMGNVYKGSLGTKLTGYAIELGFDGSVSGATDATARAIYDGKSGEEILSDATTGAIGGAVGGIILGGAMKGLSNAAHNVGVEVGSEINPAQAADVVEDVIPPQIVADLAEEAIPTQASREAVGSAAREVDEPVSTVKPVVDENRAIVKVEKDKPLIEHSTPRVIKDDVKTYIEGINQNRRYSVSPEDLRTAYEELDKQGREALKDLLTLNKHRGFLDCDTPDQLTFINALKIAKSGEDGVARVKQIIEAKYDARFPLREKELVWLAELTKEDGDFALKVLNLDIEKSQYSHVRVLLEENKKSPINLDACKDIVELDFAAFSDLDYLVELVKFGKNNIEVVADYMKNYPEQYAHLVDMLWHVSRRDLLNNLNADNVQVLNKLIEECPSDYNEYSYILGRVTSENKETLLRYMENSEIGEYVCSKIPFYANMLKAYDENPDITKALVDADIFFANSFELCKEYPDCIGAVKAIAEVASSLKNNSRKFDTTLREIVPKIKGVLENNKDISSERLVNIMRKFTQLYVDEPRFSYKYNNILTQNLENIEALLEIKDVNLISELQYRVLHKDKDFDLTPYIEVVKKYSSSAYNFTRSNLPFLKQLDELSDKYSFINSKFVSDFLSKASRSDLSPVQNIEPVVALLEKNKNLQLSPETFVNMLKTNPQKSIDILSGKYPSTIKPNSAQMYEQTFVSFVEEANKFGCKSMSELETYVKTATFDRAAAGKLLGQIKKATLDDFEEFVPEDLRVFLYNENGVFTAANFEKILSKINSNKELKAIFEYSRATKQELPGSAEITAASIMAKDAVHFKAWEKIVNDAPEKLKGDGAKEFVKLYSASEKLANLFAEKLLDFIKLRHPAQYSDIKREAARPLGLLDVQLTMQAAMSIVGESNLKTIINDEAIAKAMNTCSALMDLSKKSTADTWRQIFATKGLKDNEVKQLISLATTLDEDVLTDVVSKSQIAGKIDASKMLTEVFNLVAKTIGDEYTNKPELVKGWDLRYFPYILTAQKELSSSNAELLQNLLKATFDGRYKEHLFAETPNGLLNRDTRAIFKSEKLDFATWMNFDKEHKFNLRQNSAEIDDVQNLVTSTIGDLNVISQNAKLAPILANYLKQSGVLFENGKLTDLSGHSLNAEKLQTLTQSLIQFTKEQGRVMKDAGILDIRDHLLVRQKALKQTNKATPSNIEFTIRLWKRDPKHDLFQGHYCGCCISLDGCNKQAIVQSLTHVVDNTIELVDAAGETVGKAKVLWMKDNNTGEPIFLVNGFEIPGDNMYNNQIRDEFTEFFKEYSKAVAGKEVTIVTGICDYQKVKIDDLEDFSTNINMLGKFPNDTYHLDTFYKTEGSHPSKLSESKDLTTKVLYKPVVKDAHKFVEAQELVNKAIVIIREIINTKGLNIEIPEFTMPKSLKQLEILADNIEILAKKIAKDDKIESKLEQVEYALKLLSDENEQKQVRKYAEELHNRADFYAEFLTDCSGKVFADDYEIEDVGAGIWKIKGETPFGTIGGRVKTVDSLYSKLVNEVLDLNVKAYDETILNAAVRDSYGFRVMPNASHRKPIVVKDVAQNAAQTHKDSYYGTSGMTRYTLEEAIADFYKKGFKGTIWKTLSSDQQRAVRDIVIENRSKAFVDRLISQVKSGFIRLDKISNYTTSFDEKLPYFTANQLGQIADAVKEVTGERLNIVSFEGGNPKGSTRDCGYTAAQMNMTFANANDVMVECQYRDIEVHDFAELEHVEYDIDQNKITVRGEVYEEHRTLFSDMSTEAKKVNNKFTSDLYAYYHLKALGVEEVEKPDVYKMFDEACAEGKITKDEYDKIRDRLHLLTEVGLQALHK